MDKTAIRAKAKRLQVYAQQFGRFTQHGYQGVHSHNNLETEKEIDDALTQAYEQGWNERGEADAKACAEVGRKSTKQVRKFIQAFSVSSNHIGQFFAEAVKAIRRLRIEKGE